MSKISDISGLPEELAIWDEIAKESQEISVYLIKKKFGKKYTIVEGIDSKEVDIKDITKKLKSKFACGGSFKDGRIELQGDHKKKVREFLITLGFPAETIILKQDKK